MPDNDEVAINHLQRRKIEGRVLISFIETLRQKLGENGMREIVDATIAAKPISGCLARSAGIATSGARAR